MLKKFLSGMLLCVSVLMIAVTIVPVNHVFAQTPRTIVPYPREMTVETIDPTTQAPKNLFCIGVNAIDVKLTNNSGYRKYVYVMNRDTSGAERVLYTGWIEAGVSYLSRLMNTQLEVTGPAGMEMIRVDSSDGGQVTPGNWVSFQVQNCGGTYPPYPPYGQATVWAQVAPYAIPQGGKGTITLQTTVASQANMTYYFEILNSWGQLWKRFPVNKRPYERYTVTLPVGKTTKPAILTYTVKVWLESGIAGGRREVASTRFSFRVVTPGTAAADPYVPGYAEYQGYPTYPGYPAPEWYPSYEAAPYSGMSSESGMPYLISPYEAYPYGSSGYPMGSQGERPIN